MLRARTLVATTAGTLAALGLIGLAAAAVQKPAGSVTAAPETILVLALPADDDHVGILLRRPAEENEGPAGLTVGPDGTIWIADSLHDRLLGYARDGTETGRIDLRDAGLGLSDVAVSGHEIAVLSIGDGRLARLDRETGAVLEVIELPPDVGMEAGLTGIAFGPTGELLLELGSRTATRATATSRAWNIATGRPTAGGPFRIRPTFTPPHDGDVVEVTWGSVAIRVTIAGAPGGVAFLGEGDGTIDLWTTESSQDAAGVIHVDCTIRRFDRLGRQVAIGRYPVASSLTYVDHPVVSASDGTVLGLVTSADRVEVLQITMGASVAPILP